MPRISTRPILISVLLFFALSVVIGTGGAIYLAGDAANVEFSRLDLAINGVIVAAVPLLTAMLVRRVEGTVPIRFILIGWVIVAIIFVILARHIGLAIGYIFLFIFFASGLVAHLPAHVAANVAAVLDGCLCLMVMHGLAYLIGHEIVRIKRLRTG
jgi:hypothetical protein